jgi:hypothetical protein
MIIEKIYLHVLQAYRKICVDISVMGVPREDVKIHGIVWQNESI